MDLQIGVTKKIIKKINKKTQNKIHVKMTRVAVGSFTIVLTRSWTYAKHMLRTLLDKMEDDDQHGTVEVINDEEDDNEEGVLMDTPIGPEAVLMDTAAVPQVAQHDDNDAQHTPTRVQGNRNRTEPHSVLYMAERSVTIAPLRSYSNH